MTNSDGITTLAAPGLCATPARRPVLQRADCAADAPDAALRLAADLGGDLALVLVFASPDADFAALMAGLRDAMPGQPMLGCTTAGEICGGYVEGRILAIGFPARHFAARIVPVEDLNQLSPLDIVTRMVETRDALARAHPDMVHEFAHLIIDGSSFREDALMQIVARGLGPVPLFGGSAGDGRRFGQTFLAIGDRVITNAAALTFLRSRCRVRVFSLDHLDVGRAKMVVTRADPARRQVFEINAAPAATEYARILGMPPGQLDPMTFAAHPLVVQAGGRHHVRSIQRVENGTDLVFFSAIDEGVVLTRAIPRDIVASLADDLTALADPVAPDAILACDCILRRVQVQQRQQSRDMSRLLDQHGVIGFSTYGEQFGAMHVNMTMTGVAIYPPDQDDAP